MIIRAFTGPTQLFVEQQERFKEWVYNMEVADETRSGCAYGVDTLVLDCYLDFPTNGTLHLFIPGASHNRSMVEDAKLLVPEKLLKITKCDRMTIPALTYRVRNNWMVQGVVRLDIPSATELCAVVYKPTFYRSGEWMTINIAKYLGIPVKKLVLEN